MKISVIVPVFSETESVFRCVDGLKRSLDPSILHEIILVVAPASTPECLAICRKLAESDPLVRFLLQRRTPGQGWAMREAIPQASGTHLLFYNSDDETDPAALPGLVTVAREGVDVAIASRWLKGGGFEGYGFSRRILNGLFQGLVRALFRVPVTDATYIYRLVSARSLHGLTWRSTGHEFCLELLLKLIKSGASLKEVPTRWTRRSEGVSKNNWRIQLRYVSVLFRERFGG